MGGSKGDAAGAAVYLFYDGLAAFVAKSPPWGESWVLVVLTLDINWFAEIRPAG